jgi:acyl-coenzyme A synthetase/AMP-(fatty) acid ligase
MDTSGRIHILGRRDDVIVRAGQKIHPAEIEDCIAEIDGVQECAVVGGRKKSGDETIVAYVCSDRYAELLDTHIVSVCRDELPPAKVPGVVKFCPAHAGATVGLRNGCTLSRATVWSMN